jgi:hypothetical protein
MKMTKMFVHCQLAQKENVELVRQNSISFEKKNYFFSQGPTKPTDGYLQGCDLDQIDKCM